MDGRWIIWKLVWATIFIIIGTLEERNGKKVILIYDGAAIHIRYSLSKLAIDNGVILIKLPSNLTHYMQPLDESRQMCAKASQKLLEQTND